MYELINLTYSILPFCYIIAVLIWVFAWIILSHSASRSLNSLSIPEYATDLVFTVEDEPRASSVFWSCSCELRFTKASNSVSASPSDALTISKMSLFTFSYDVVWIDALVVDAWAERSSGFARLPHILDLWKHLYIGYFKSELMNQRYYYKQKDFHDNINTLPPPRNFIVMAIMLPFLML